MSNQLALYQQVILEHNRKPRNFREIDQPSHSGEGFNPLCGDHLWVYLQIDEAGLIQDLSFKGSGCAISKASASMMTAALKGKSVMEAETVIKLFKDLLKGSIEHDGGSENILGKLKIFSGIWQYPSRVKCAGLAWHTLSEAMSESGRTASTE